MQEINIKILMENLRGRGHLADLGEERKTVGY
jgi:c-di-AMP phosphodiesterase-like protein